MKQRTLISVVIPLYNEAANLPELADRLQRTMHLMHPNGFDFEPILVDDHSNDETPRLAKDMLSRLEYGRYVRLARNCGSYSALAAGVAYCTGHCAILMAADLQDPPEFIPTLVSLWREGHDVVWATRARREGESVTNLAFASIFYWTMRKIALPEMPRKGADFVLIDRKVIRAYSEIREKNSSIMTMLMWLGFRQTHVDYVKEARHAGRSKWTVAKKLKLFVDSIVSFSYVPIRLMSLIGLCMAFAGFLYAVVVIVGRLVGWVGTGAGFAALMSVLLVGQGIIMTMLGVLGEYVWRTYDEARGRPQYIIEEMFHCSDARSNNTDRNGTGKSVAACQTAGSSN
jgi:dolichol-phosphate mannosyltransferase